jgi:ATP-dependent RNA helicase RhlE
MSQNQRQKAIDGFRDGKYDILIATDIAARGIDVSDISHVINFDMPDTTDAYTHRIGRTGRAHQSGEAFTFAVQDDEPIVRDIENVLGTSIERRRLADFNYGSFDPESEFRQNHSQPRPQTSSQRGTNNNHAGHNNCRNGRRRIIRRR